MERCQDVGCAGRRAPSWYRHRRQRIHLAFTVALLVLGAACTPSPSAPTAPSPTVQVGDGPPLPLRTGEICLPTDGLVRVRLSFPPAADLEAVARHVAAALPKGARIERTGRWQLEVHIPKGYDAVLRIPAPSAAGDPPGHAVEVHLARPGFWEVLAYVLRGVEDGRLRADAAGSARVLAHRPPIPSPDGRQLLVVPDPWSGDCPPVPQVIGRDGSVWDVPLPEGEVLAFGGWLPDGTALLVGRHAWRADPRSRRLDDQGATPGAWAAWPSPRGRYVAFWHPGRQGQLHILDTRTQRTQVLRGNFRTCAEDAAIFVRWSPDERLLATSDCELGASLRTRTRIIDPNTGKTVREFTGYSPVAWLASGHIVLASLDVMSGRVDYFATDGGGRHIRALGTFSGIVPGPDGKAVLGLHSGSGPVAQMQVTWIPLGMDRRPGVFALPEGNLYWLSPTDLLVIRMSPP